MDREQLKLRLRQLELAVDAIKAEIYSDVDGIRVRYQGGWFLCRPSNTEPILVMRAEGKDQVSLESIISDVKLRIGHLADIEKLI